MHDISCLAGPTNVICSYAPEDIKNVLSYHKM